MNNTFSILLDVVRFVAALLVFIHHSEQILKVGYLSPLASFGHDAVILFFILSGFVIGYVSKYKEIDLRSYAIARVARIYSVAVPSLVLVYGLNLLGSNYFPDVYSQFEVSNWPEVLVSSLVFLNQSHWWTISVPTNGPYWSICYEVWYYLLFGVAFYIKGFIKYLLLAATIFSAGVKIVLLMPIWLLGFGLFKYHGSIKTSKLAGIIMILVALVLYAALRYTNYDDVLFRLSASIFGGEDKANQLLGYSKRFVPDYLIAVIFSMLFVGIYFVKDIFHFKEYQQRVIKLFSSYTFSLYLYHYPILLFLSCFIESSAYVIGLTLLVIGLLGKYSEQKKSVLSGVLKKISA